MHFVGERSTADNDNDSGLLRLAGGDISKPKHNSSNKINNSHSHNDDDDENNSGSKGRNNNDNSSNNSTASSIASSTDSGVVLHETGDNNAATIVTPRTTTTTPTTTITITINERGSSRRSSASSRSSQRNANKRDEENATDGCAHVSLRHISKDNAAAADSHTTDRATPTTKTTSAATAAASESREREPASAAAERSNGHEPFAEVVAMPADSAKEAGQPGDTSSQTGSARSRRRQQQQQQQQEQQATQHGDDVGAATQASTSRMPQRDKANDRPDQQRRDGGDCVTSPPSIAGSTPACPTSTRLGHNGGSPTISIRSTTISIASIDENEIESSVYDSESEFVDSDEADQVDHDHLAAAERGAYVVKRLGQQVTYPPHSPHIPETAMLEGRTVVGQSITPHGFGAPDSLQGVVEKGIAGLVPAPHSTLPQIGSIALTNSSDVTFGDKHFYEGPVTIHQFLINEKAKNGGDGSGDGAPDGQDNPAFDGQSKGAGQPHSGQNHQRSVKYIYRRKAFIITGIVAAILIGVGIVLTITLPKAAPAKSKPLGDGDDYRKNIPINSTIAQDNFGNGRILRIVARDSWLAQPPSKPLVPLQLPVEKVIVLPTQTDTCETQAACTYRVRYIQTYNIESQQTDDIIYNFLIGGDGNVYEGRGWLYEGAHVKDYNDYSVSFAYIGTFKLQKPSPKQMNVTQLLLDEGLRLGYLAKDYQIVSAYRLDPTSIFTSAQALYDSFIGWPHWLNATA